MNEGEFLKEYIKNKPVKITRVVELTGIKRATIYTHFHKQKLDSTLKELYSNTIGVQWDAHNVDNTAHSNSFSDIERDAHKDNIYTENSTLKALELKNSNIPMYNIPVSASNVEMYGDPNDIKIVGYLNIPGATKNSFALPVHGHSMYPTLENGSWGVVRPIQDKRDIEWGQIYYIEYGDYKVWKRLIKDDEDKESVILYSDNITEMVNGKAKYASKTIKSDRILKLCLLTDILKKPNY